ncbi:hypothetical protein HPB48_004586 [Haemaphysalis longicornis]|uniref:YqaJ viral recombinase domain-containing protein n=1 Tax=Haemaphysalis longicornis TaxID=44386 RepID=A0A9J6FFI1_HAELO|nr:hypothetical protein HPB48_004586 [Haemaphysalis longicornis]
MGAPCGASYSSSLCGSDRQRYEDKTELCGVDPFDPGVRYVANVDLWPRVDKCDIMDFLVLRTSFVSRKQPKAYKSMDGHNYVTSGWVQEPLLKQVSADTVIVITQACSHVAALLFYLEYGVRARDGDSCTDVSNSWLPPHVRKIVVRPVEEIDFSSSTMKKKVLDGECRPKNTPNGRPKPAAPPPTKAEWKVLFDAVVASGLRPAVLSTHPDYSDMFVPAIRACNSSDLRLIYDCAAKNLDYEGLMQLCEQIFDSFVITEQACESIESRTRSQALSANCYAYRTGRVTASKLYDVCHTRLESPLASLLKTICMPHADKPSTPPMKYGREKDAEALLKYKSLSEKQHEDVNFKEAGLFVRTEHVYLGATPDLLVECSCCGASVVEVKCPWKVKDGQLSDLLSDKNGCVTEVDGELELKKTHRYY